MDNRQKQQALVKLAQVRLAINHVQRQRALSKQAQAPAAPIPEPANWNSWGSFFNPWGAQNYERRRGEVIQQRLDALNAAKAPRRPPQKQPDVISPATLYFKRNQRDRQKLDPANPNFGGVPTPVYSEPNNR